MARLLTALVMKLQSAPATPVAGEASVYIRSSDGRLSILDSSGIEKELMPIHVGTTAPTSPALGDLWVDTT